MFRRSFIVMAFPFAASLLGTAANADVAPRERSRIERLIQFVASRNDMTFIRNGSAYTAEQAARFLRGKFESMGDDVTTAHDFIVRIASRSSMSGRAYEIRFADGRVVLAEQFLVEELQRIERQQPA